MLAIPLAVDGGLLLAVAFVAALAGPLPGSGLPSAPLSTTLR